MRQFGHFEAGNPHRMKPRASTDAVELYHADLLAGRLKITQHDVRRELRGKDLARLVPADQPRHADT